MQKIIFTILCTLLVKGLVSQTQDFKWVKQIGGNTNDAGYAIDIDSMRNIYTVGKFTNSVDFDPGPGAYSVTATGNDLYILKLDSNSNFLWVRSIANLASNEMSLAVDKTGNVYVTGVFNATVDFDPGPGVYSLTSSGNEAYVLKLDAAGAFLWVKKTAGFPHDITLDNNGNIYTAGYFGGTVDFDPSLSVYNLTAVGYGDICILKLDNSGNFIWAKAMGGLGSEEANSISVDLSGNVYTTGYFMGSIVDFDPGPATYTTSASNASCVFMSKLDVNGNFVWAKVILGGSGKTGEAIACDLAGNVYIAGGYSGTADFDPSASVFNMTSAIGVGSIFVEKLDNFGNFIWAKSMGGSGNSTIALRDMALDKFANIYCIGEFGGSGTPTDFDPGPWNYDLIPSGVYNMYISKLDLNGTFVWAKKTGSFSTEIGRSIKVDTLGSVFITGEFTNSCDFDPGYGYNLVISYNGSSDAFIHKMGPCFTPLAPVITSTLSVPYCQNSNISLSAVSNATVTWHSSPTSTNALSTGYTYALPTNLAPGTYTYYAQANTCTVSAGRTPVSFTVMASPGMTLSGNSSICAGQSSILSTTGAQSYTWTTGSNSNSITVNPPNSTIYRVSGTTAANCISTKTIGLTVNPLPVISVAGSNTVCEGSKGIFTLGNATTYTCTSSLSNTLTGNTLSTMPMPSGVGVYTITGTSSFGCVGSPTIINVYSKPSPTVTINSGTICSGNIFTFTPLGADTYMYSSVTNTVSPTATTNYSVTGYALNGCVGVAISTVSVNPSPAINVNSGSICSGQVFTISPSGASSYTYSSGSSTVAPVTNSTYTVTAANTNGCIGSAISFVTVNPMPTIAVNSGTICTNQTFTIIPSGANTYTYSSGTNTVSPSVNSTYTVTGTNLNGCVNSVGAISTVSVNAAPIITAQNASVCVGTSTVLNISGANTYSWTTGATASSITVMPTVTTIYTVTGTNLNNCSSTQTVAVTVNQTCQDVWPGDANSDGLVDNTDVLELGLHFTQSGPARASTSNNWQSYFANNWTGAISNGKNLNHSDCNGDGTINNNDTLAIFNNYGLMHAFKPTGPTAVNPQLSIVPDQNAVAKGVWGTSSVFLGEASAPISNINGLAFTVTFDQNLIDANSFYIEYPASFLNTGNQNLKFSKPDFANGKLYTATTHTIANNVSGNGKIATLHYKIKSTLATDEVLTIGITQSKQSNASGVLTPLTAGTTTIAAIGASVGMDELSNGNSIGIYPNPANASVTIQSSTTLEKIELLSITGQVILSGKASRNQHQLDLTDVANGVYFVVVSDATQKVTRKKLVVQR